MGRTRVQTLSCPRPLPPPARAMLGMLILGPQREYKLLTFLYAPDLSQHKIDISIPETVLLATC